MILFFWILLALIFFTYFGYPIFLAFISRFTKKEAVESEICPSVSVIIAAHNEQNSIRSKIENTLNLDYPQDRLEIIIASDASNDKTVEIVNNLNHNSIKCLNFSDRRGKTFVQNEAVKLAKGEIILFTDATTELHPKSLEKIVRNFADPEVGAVGGELVYVNKRLTAIGEGEGVYWKYEKYLKKKESQISSLIGVSGCCYAIRREMYEPIRPDLISDFVIAQLVYKKGKRVVYEPGAISYEETCEKAGDEFKMRVRVAARTLYGIWYMKSLLNPFKYGFFSAQLIFHKVLRYLIPIFLALLLIVNVILYFNSPYWHYKLSLYLQIVFYLSAALGLLLHKRKKIFNLAFYFCLTNFALLVGLLCFLRGERQVTWSPLRR